MLRTQDDFVIVDFEGEPARTLDERRAKHSPVKDVAGMLRSLCYAAESARRAGAGSAAATRTWQRAAGAQFLRAYRETIRRAALVPAATPAFRALLEAYLLDKALYELRYELDNRPDWVGIPLTGILEMSALA